jgi:hypothetical protein
VCSGRCRARRWRETRAARDPEIRAALEAIAQLVQGMLGRLKGDGINFDGCAGGAAAGTAAGGVD